VECADKDWETGLPLAEDSAFNAAIAASNLRRWPTDLIPSICREFAENVGVNVIVAECSFISLKIEPAQPSRDVHFQFRETWSFKAVLQFNNVTSELSSQGGKRHRSRSREFGCKARWLRLRHEHPEDRYGQ
jgi:hypothetical protein